MEKIILASGSPRRKEIFEKNNVIFETIVSDVDESYSSTYSKEQIAMIIALRKALDIEMKYKEGIVIAADTIVCIDEILGKPTDREHAY
ncbi:MAG: Maf-like protein, partial [Clostridiales bacterium]|nr:Maf-like protein [Clostridiales bacterium]